MPKVMSQLTTAKGSEPRNFCFGCRNPLPEEFKSSDLCPACEKITRERIAADRAKRRESEWQRRCPALFLATDVAKLPNQDAYKRAMEWKYNPTGLLLHGPTRRGKSRTAWEIVKREHFAGHAWTALNSSSALHFASLFGNSAREAEEWVKGLCQVELLLLDDPFKVKLTEAFEAALFSVIDRRQENLLPIIATTNDVGESLVKRMTGDRGEPFVCRLRESCEAISFV